MVLAITYLLNMLQTNGISNYLFVIRIRNLIFILTSLPTTSNIHTELG